MTGMGECQQNKKLSNLRERHERAGNTGLNKVRTWAENSKCMRCGKRSNKEIIPGGCLPWLQMDGQITQQRTQKNRAIICSEKWVRMEGFSCGVEHVRVTQELSLEGQLLNSCQPFVEANKKKKHVEITQNM